MKFTQLIKHFSYYSFIQEFKRLKNPYQDLLQLIILNVPLPFSVDHLLNETDLCLVWFLYSDLLAEVQQVTSRLLRV